MVIDIYSYHLSPFCWSVLATAKELGIKYNLKNIELKENGEQFSPEFLKMNPAHLIPTIVDDGFVLWESRAIMRYLCDKYQPNGTLYPRDLKKRAIVDRWLDFDLTLLNSGKQTMWSKVLLGTQPSEEKLTYFLNHMKVFNQLIGDNKYLTGDQLTIADLSMLSNTLYIMVSGIELSEYPNYVRWITDLQKELPYFTDIYMSGTTEQIQEFRIKNKDYLSRKMNE